MWEKSALRLRRQPDMTANKNAAPGWHRDAAGLHTKSPTQYTAKLYTIGEVERLFTDAMRDAGIQTDDRIIGDGKLHRIHVEGDKRGTKNGWYVLFMDRIPTGEFGSWKAGVCSTWRANIGRSLTRTEQAEQRTRIDVARALRNAEQATERAACRARAESIWITTGEVHPDHNYLIRKGIGAHGMHGYGPCLIVPVRDTAGTLHGLQMIDGTGNKRFLKGTAKAGCFYLLTSPVESAAARLAIAEGFATAATVHEVTGWPVAVAFDAGNLEPVARALRSKYPDARILICADNDHGTPGNPGITKGRAAAQAVGGIVLAPAFAAGDAWKDWNDYRRRYGSNATTAALRKAAREVPNDA